MPNPDLQRSVWHRLIDTVHEHNHPGVFTAFHGFEWTSTPDLRNPHRVVIFRDDREKAKQVLPFSIFDSVDAKDFWDYL